MYHKRSLISPQGLIKLQALWRRGGGGGLLERGGLFKILWQPNTMSMEFEMLRSFNYNNYELLCYIANTINTIKNWLEILKTEIKSFFKHSMPSVLVITAFLLREEGLGGGGLLKRRGLIETSNLQLGIY